MGGTLSLAGLEGGACRVQQRTCLPEAFRQSGAVSEDAGFDPARSRRRFRIVCPDDIATLLAAPLVEVFRRAAPHATSVICDATPFKPRGILLKLAGPLPTHIAARGKQAWFIKLGYGTICSFLTGATSSI